MQDGVNENKYVKITKYVFCIDICFIFVEENNTKKIEIMTTYSIIKKVYGQEMNQLNVKNYATKEDATNAGNSWLRDCRIHAEIRKGRNFEVIENTENSFKFTGIAKSN